jgi:hypothetical protein
MLLMYEWDSGQHHRATGSAANASTIVSIAGTSSDEFVVLSVGADTSALPSEIVRATRESPEFELIVNQKKISRTRVYTPVP